MRKSIAFTTSTALAFALAACGSSTDSEEDAAGVEVEEVEVDDLVSASEEVEADGEEADAAEGDGEEGEEDDAGEGASDVDGEEESAEAEAAPAPAPVVAAGPPASFTTCAICHSVDAGTNMVGPSLAGVFGRQAGSVAGANYSPAMQDSGITWTEDNLRRYLVDPSSVVSGSTMPPPGVSGADAQAIVDYLKTL